MKTATNRQGSVQRDTKETQISMTVSLDRNGPRSIKTPLPFFSHMLDAFACHARIGLELDAQGDIEVDPHHLMEDTGIVLGQCLFQALGGFTGIERAGSFTFPMDGTLATVSIDLCGRRNLVWNLEFANFPIGNLDPNLFKEFYKGLVDGLRGTVHVNVPYQDNNHHAIEAVMKAFARAFRIAMTQIDEDVPLSTKGMIDVS